MERKRIPSITEDVALRTAERAYGLLEPSSMVGAATWKAILTAVEGLWPGRREGEPPN